MKKILLIAITAISLSANILTVKVNNEIKINSWEEDTGFFDPAISFNKKENQNLTLCIIKKGETSSLILCLEDGTNKTFGSEEKGTYLTKDSFIPENNFIELKEMSVKIGG